jgi:ABC-type lipoprotein export system ATPase subunit
VSDDLTWARPAGPETGSGQGSAAARVVLRASAVTRTFVRGSESVVALDGVDLELVGGELVALVGRSGSGKTTLLNVLCGWEQPETGTVQWCGHPEGANVAHVKWEGISLVPQTPGLLEDLTVVENVGLPCRLRGDPDGPTELAVAELLESLGLSELSERFPDEISLGEQQRTSVARALLLVPDLLLADEPTAHQDAVSMSKVLDAIRSVVATGRACLVASHSAEVLRVADRVLEMRDGRLSVSS